MFACLELERRAVISLRFNGKRNWSIIHALSICIDIVIGITLWHLLDGTDSYDVFWSSVYSLIDHLDKLVTWITKNPAGLKLNEPVNTALAAFFRYHIYLWYTFVRFLRIPVLWQGLMYSLWLGISVASALFADLITLLTLHIQCFDVYASRLAGISWTSLASLWRVFRGKKWNPLRQRVDSVQLDSRQQFVSTLLFSLLLFFLPTIIVYFAVFRLLRLALSVCREALIRLSQLPTTIDGVLYWAYGRKEEKLE